MLCSLLTKLELLGGGLLLDNKLLLDDSMTAQLASLIFLSHFLSSLKENNKNEKTKRTSVLSPLSVIPPDTPWSLSFWGLLILLGSAPHASLPSLADSIAHFLWQIIAMLHNAKWKPSWAFALRLSLTTFENPCHHTPLLMSFEFQCT